MRLAPVLAVLALLLVSPALAQQAPEGRGPVVLVSPVLTVEQERLFGESAWGKRVSAEFRASLAALEAENQRIAEGLTAEEKALTERRTSMRPEDFRVEADAFDARVTGIRRAQDAKSRDISRAAEAERAAFYEAALPVMGAVMAQRGAVAILERKAVFLAAEAIDVTDDLVARIDATLGAGPEAAPPAATED